MDKENQSPILVWFTFSVAPEACIYLITRGRKSESACSGSCACRKADAAKICVHVNATNRPMYADEHHRLNLHDGGSIFRTREI